MREKAQSFNEYAMVIALITLVGMGMQTYIKRGIQGVVKGSADVLAVYQKDPTPVSLAINLANGNIYDQEYWHPVAQAYYDRYPGFPSVVKNGNDIYYYLTSGGVKTKIGGQDAVTGDFTSFDGEEGYPKAVYNSSGIATHLYERVENYDAITKTTQITYNEVEFDIVAGVPTVHKDPISGEPAPPIRTGLTYDKYEILRLNSTPSEGELAQKKGVQESGLYRLQQVEPLKVNIKKNIPVSVFSLKTTTFDNRASWHPTAIAYYNSWVGHISSSLDMSAERTGNDIYYYQRIDGVNKRFGGEDAITREFTSFDGYEGYPKAVYDSFGTATHLYERVENYDAITKTTQITYNEVEFDIVAGVPTVHKDPISGEPAPPIRTGLTYDKYEILRLSSTPYTGPSVGTTGPVVLPAGDTKKSLTAINQDETKVTGIWNTTYKAYNLETFNDRDRKGGKGLVPPLPVDPKKIN